MISFQNFLFCVYCLQTLWCHRCWGPQDHLQVWRFARRTHKTQKSYHTHGLSHRKDTDWTRQRQEAQGQSPGKIRDKFPAVVSRGIIEQHFISQQHMWQDIWILPNGDSRLSLGVEVSSLGVSQAGVADCPMWPTLVTQFPATPPDPVWPRFPTINQTVSMICLAAQRPHTDRHLTNRIFSELRESLSGASRGLVLVLECERSEHTSPLVSSPFTAHFFQTDVCFFPIFNCTHIFQFYLVGRLVWNNLVRNYRCRALRQWFEYCSIDAAHLRKQKKQLMTLTFTLRVVLLSHGFRSFSLSLTCGSYSVMCSSVKF